MPARTSNASCGWETRNGEEWVGIRFGSLPTAVGIGYFLGEQESNGICIKKLNDRKQEARNKK